MYSKDYNGDESWRENRGMRESKELRRVKRNTLAIEQAFGEESVEQFYKIPIFDK